MIQIHKYDKIEEQTETAIWHETILWKFTYLNIASFCIKFYNHIAKNQAEQGIIINYKAHECFSRNAINLF